MATAFNDGASFYTDRLIASGLVPLFRMNPTGRNTSDHLRGALQGRNYHSKYAAYVSHRQPACRHRGRQPDIGMHGSGNASQSGQRCDAGFDTTLIHCKAVLDYAWNDRFDHLIGAASVKSGRLAVIRISSSSSIEIRRPRSAGRSCTCARRRRDSARCRRYPRARRSGPGQSGGQLSLRSPSRPRNRSVAITPGRSH